MDERPRRVRGAAAAVAAAAEKDLRGRCVEVFKALEKGNTRDAVRLTSELTRYHPESAMGFNLRGYVLEIAVCESNAVAREIIHNSTEEAYATASTIETKCAVTGVSHGKSLAVCDRMADAYKELKRAERIVNPIDPAKTHYRLPKELQAEDADVRRTAAAGKAKDELLSFESEAEETVISECDKLVKTHSNSVTTMQARQARVDAQILASRFPFSVRAQTAFPHLLMSYVANLSPEIPKRPFYERVLRRLQDPMDDYDSSLVLSLLQAEILFAMGRFDDAHVECQRGMNIRSPDDPLYQDMPPGKFFKRTKRERINMAMTALKNLSDNAKEQLLLNANLAPEEVQAEEEDIQEIIPNLPQEDLDEEQQGIQLAEQENPEELVPALNVLALAAPAQHEKFEIKQSLMYNERKQKIIPLAHVRPEQVIDGIIVPVDVVDLYAEYCSLMGNCAKKKVVCQLCVFEKGIYLKHSYPESDMILHGLTHGTSVKCDILDCHVRVRKEDKTLHLHFCHTLREGWWKAW